jgi:peptidoglycan/xylan/chitin deacetylase (PgdA/CDA1 family)
MNWKRKISCGISELSALTGKLTGPRHGLRVLMYHSINTGKPQRTNGPVDIFTVSSHLFKNHIQILANASSLSVVGLMEGLNSISHDHQTVAITFDDGYNDNLYTAAPLLIELGIPFTVFITSEPVREGKSNFLTPSEIRELSQLPGVNIGAHGATHTPLTTLDDLALENELISSKHYLEDIIGQKIDMISYPHGAVDMRVRDAVSNAGYKIGACSRFGLNKNTEEPLTLRRTTILTYDSQRAFTQKLHGDWDWYDQAQNYHKLSSLFRKKTN